MVYLSILQIIKCNFIYRKEEIIVVREIRHNADYPDAYQEFLGVSADTKPTDCGMNSLFLELDTGNVYYWNKQEWLQVGAAVDNSSPIDAEDR